MKRKRQRHRIGGTIFKRKIDAATKTNAKARKALRRIADEEPGPMTLAQLLTQAALALSENLDALREIKRIAQYSAQYTEKLEKKIEELAEESNRKET